MPDPSPLSLELQAISETLKNASQIIDRRMAEIAAKEKQLNDDIDAWKKDRPPADPVSP